MRSHKVRAWAVAVLVTAVLPAGTSASDPMRGRKELNDEELQEIRQLEGDVEGWGKAAGEHELRAKAILRSEGERRMGEFKRRFRGPCVGASQEYKKRQAASLDSLEGFLKKYPDDPRWTPDVMFRLGDLYYDRAWEQFNELDDPACSHLTDVKGREQTDADNPEYSLAINTWKDIVRRFPNYRLAAAAIYMAGIFTGDPRPFGMGAPGEAKSLYLGLVCRNRFDPLAAKSQDAEPRPACPSPDPSLLKVDPYEGCQPMASEDSGFPEITDDTWYRIGDVHFNARCELPQAIFAFKRALVREDSKVYEDALYKLAWSYYKFNQYQEAIDSFDRFVVRADQAEAEGKKKFTFRKEAVQYLGYSFADPWPGEQLTDPVRALERMETHYKDHQDWRHVREAYDALGDALKEYAGLPLEGTAPSPDLVIGYLTAVRAWGSAIEKWPYDPRNPEIHKKILETLELIGDEAESKKAIAYHEAQISERYKKPESCESDYNWYCANETNREAMTAAAELAENALLKTAISMHGRAQEQQAAWERGRTLEDIAKAQDDPVRQEYQATYKTAAGLYERFLGMYPTSRQMPAIMYYLGDCYFQMDEFDTAVDGHYMWLFQRPALVPSGLLEAKVYEDSARRILESRQRAIRFAVAAGTLKEPPLIPGHELDANAQPLAMDPLYQALLAAIELYSRHFPGDGKAAANEYDAGLVAYEHLMLDEALRRFERVLKDFCQSDHAVKSKEWILAIYQARNDKAAFNRTVDSFVSGSCGKPDELKMARQQKAKYALYEADELMKQGKLFDAADAMYVLYRATDASRDDPSRDNALYFAGAFYLAGGRYRTAIEIFEQFTKEFDKLSEFYLEAKFGLALAYERYFDYENASRVYLEWIDLYEKYKNDRGRTWRSSQEFDPAKSSLNAWMGTAELREVEGVLKDRGGVRGALSLYAEFERRAAQSGDPRAADASWKIGEIQEQLGEDRRAREQYASWRGRYATDPTKPEVRTKYVKTFYGVARTTKTRRDWEAVLNAYRLSGLEAADREGQPSEAVEWAGEAAFRIAEMNVESFKKYQIKWNEKKLEKGDAPGMFSDGFSALRDAFEQSSAGYVRILNEMPVSSWYVAALVKIGDLALSARDKMVNAPVPRLVKKLDRELPDDGILGQFKSTLEGRAMPEYMDPETFDSSSGAAAPDNAMTAKVVWEKALDLAAKAGIVNEWSQGARVRLNANYRDLYPLNRDDILEPEVRP